MDPNAAPNGATDPNAPQPQAQPEQTAQVTQPEAAPQPASPDAAPAPAEQPQATAAIVVDQAVQHQDVALEAPAEGDQAEPAADPVAEPPKITDLDKAELFLERALDGREGLQEYVAQFEAHMKVAAAAGNHRLQARLSRLHTVFVDVLHAMRHE